MKKHVLEKKEAVVDEIKKNIESSSAMVIVDYRGLNVEQLTELRSNFRSSDVVYKVYKNTMMNLAFKELELPEITELLKGPNGFAFSMKDPMAAARVSNDFAKTNEALEIKGGFLEGKFLNVEEVKEVASIPSREVLLSRLLGSFKSPMANFARLIDAIAKSKEEEKEEVTAE